MLIPRCQKILDYPIPEFLGSIDIHSKIKGYDLFAARTFNA